MTVGLRIVSILTCLSAAQFSAVAWCAPKKRALTVAVRTQKLEAANPQFWPLLAQFPFRPDFKWGVGTSDFQLSGSQNEAGRPCRNSWTMQDLPQPGESTGHWTRYKEDIQLIKQAGLNAHRFSIEWSKVNPAPGVFDQDVMNHYVAYINEMIAQGIEPIPCMFHHAWPEWLEAMGGFENPQSVEYFKQYVAYVFKHTIHIPQLRMWMSFNEPVGYAMEGWIRGHYPPFKKNQFKLCGKAVLNMLRSHVEMYHLAHSMRADVQIGFPHIFQPLDSYHWFNPLVSGVCSQMNYLLHDVALNYFKTGKFDWNYTLGSVKAHDERAKGALDYIGINYYTHTTLKMSLPGSIGPQYKSDEKMMGHKALHPKGLMDAIKKCAKLGIPMYITENGISDPDDIFKDEYMREHLAIVVQALRQGYDIRGYFWWTLMDCFEWSRNAKVSEFPERNRATKPVFSKMGLYEVNFVTKERRLRPNTRNFVQFLLAIAKKH